MPMDRYCMRSETKARFEEGAFSIPQGWLASCLVGYMAFGRRSRILFLFLSAHLLPVFGGGRGFVSSHRVALFASRC
jgi:hypothetical protein